MITLDPGTSTSATTTPTHQEWHNALAPYHLTGMGLQGAMAAWTLLRAGLAFTWSDIDTPYCAWKASTGLIYPSGDTTSRKAYTMWSQWMMGEAPWGVGDISTTGFIELGSFWYSTATAPNGANGYPLIDLGPLRRFSLASMHLNVAEFVQHTRRCFLGLRVPDDSKSRSRGQTNIITHGYSEVLDHYVWGWSAHAYLKFDPRLEQWSGGPRACIYLRDGRYQLAYANPLPETDLWIVGSAHIPQKAGHAHVLSDRKVAEKVETWKGYVARLTHGMVQPELVGPVTQGWRPAPRKGAGTDVIKRPDGTLVFPAMGGDGVRLAPLVQQSFRRALGLETTSQC